MKELPRFQNLHRSKFKNIITLLPAKKKGGKVHLSILSFEITGMFSCGFLLPTPQRCIAMLKPSVVSSILQT